MCQRSCFCNSSFIEGELNRTKLDLIAKTKQAEENFDEGVLAGNNTKQHHCQDVANTHGEFIRQLDLLKTEIMDLKCERDSLKGMPREWFGLFGWVGVVFGWFGLSLPQNHLNLTHYLTMSLRGW